MGREFVLLGDPVAHSLSPRIHAAAFDAWGVDATYRAQRVEAAGLAAAVRSAAAGGGGNVTLPYKRAVAALLEDATPDVVETGACNCFWRDRGDTLAGDNTDVGGFIRALGDLDVEVTGAAVLILGAGGAAGAVVRAVQRLGAGRVEIWNRTTARARRLAAEVAGDVIVHDRLPEEGAYDLVVNATACGLRLADPLPMDLRGGTAAAFDLVYAPGGTPWVKHAAALGIPATDGLGMLVHQAALSLRRWFPDREPPLKEMFRAARGAPG
ncbi:MAG: shikimate dehydrogenase [Gemmatimonadota bacterium]